MPQRAVGDPAVVSAGPAQVVAVGASPFTYTNNGPNTEALYFSQPAGATTTVAKDGITIASILTPAATTIPVGAILVGPGEAVVFTYSAGAPVLVRDVL
jgi:hypothetical protein